MQCLPIWCNPLAIDARFSRFAGQVGRAVLRSPRFPCCHQPPRQRSLPAAATRRRWAANTASRRARSHISLMRRSRRLFPLSERQDRIPQSVPDDPARPLQVRDPTGLSAGIRDVEAHQARSGVPPILPCGISIKNGGIERQVQPVIYLEPAQADQCRSREMDASNLQKT